MRIEGYTPKPYTIEQAERGLEVAYDRMQRYSDWQDLPQGEAMAMTVREYIIDLHFALFATPKERAELEAHYAALAPSGGQVENLNSI